MSRPSLARVLRHAHEHILAGVAAVAITAVLLVSVSAHAAAPDTVTPSVTILVPSVTIEAVAG
jgi:hypothetical protein